MKWPGGVVSTPGRGHRECDLQAAIEAYGTPVGLPRDLLVDLPAITEEER